MNKTGYFKKLAYPNIYRTTPAEWTEAGRALEK